MNNRSVCLRFVMAFASFDWKCFLFVFYYVFAYKTLKALWNYCCYNVQKVVITMHGCCNNIRTNKIRYSWTTYKNKFDTQRNEMKCFLKVKKFLNENTIKAHKKKRTVILKMTVKIPQENNWKIWEKLKIWKKSRLHKKY